ncbi:hypothetical protein [Marinoscillum sp. MHG1-6]|uniref:hypothetical protein n=1 Tax=Marinoscillum sp. MHG1-6 TaxID=2959627 RepID=UPI0021574BE3|nr:hypothetical protein [Marinoscillum sp. MHG1-6]
MMGRLMSLLALLVLIPTLVAANALNTGDDSSTGINPPAINTFNYSTAIGVRAIGTSGITVKHFTRSTIALEGILGFWPDAFSATLLMEKHTLAFNEPGLRWYYGIGGHLAAKSNRVRYDGPGYRRASGDVGLGVDGIFGIEYKIREVPIALCMDLKPFLEVTSTGAAFVALDPGLGIKVTF